MGLQYLSWVRPLLSLVMSGVLEERLHPLIKLKKVEGKSAGPGLDEGEQFRVNLYAIIVIPHICQF